MHAHEGHGSTQHEIPSVERVLSLLRAEYGEPAPPRIVPPVDELVATILSQNTSDVNTARSFGALKQTFPTWEEVLAATDEQLANVIRSGGLADQKAPRIRGVLREIKCRTGSFDLAFLADLPLDEAKAWLTSLSGVGPKTAACVLLFSLQRPAMPVDTHVHRVASRLGWLPQGTGAERAHTILEGIVPPGDILAAHLLLIQHGRRTCRARQPACQRCVLRGDCPSAGTFTQIDRTTT